MYAIQRELTAHQEYEERDYSVDDLLSERNLPVSALNLRKECKKRPDKMEHSESTSHLIQSQLDQPNLQTTI